MAALSAWMTGGACASSFVHVAPPTEMVSRSFVVFGDKAPASPAVARQATSEAPPRPPLVAGPPAAARLEPVKAVAISASIVAFGSPAPAVTFEKVAAVEKRPTMRAQPIVIRGGIVEGIPGGVAERVTLPAATAGSPASTRAETRRKASVGKAPAPSRPIPEPIEAAPPPSRPVFAPR